MLAPKMALPAPRMIPASSTSPALGGSSTPSSGRQSLSTPSPVPSGVDEEELLGDEEMMAYIKRQQARKLASGAKKEDLDELLRFPEPLPPVPPSSPNCKLALYCVGPLLNYYAIISSSLEKLAVLILV